MSTTDDKIKSVKVDIDLHFAAIENRISHVESEIPLLEIAFEMVDQKIGILRAKRKLSESTRYKKVYLRSSKTHTECLLEFNAKSLLSEIPNGNTYRVTANGRIVKKDNSTRNSHSAPRPIMTDATRD